MSPLTNVPWEDDRGHKWSMVEPPDDELCLNCGTPNRLADGLRCSWVVRVQDDLIPRTADQGWALVEKRLREMFEEDLVRLKAKSLEYGSADLVIMGTSMEALLPQGDQLDRESRERAGLEMAMAFYLMGKASRLFGAWNKAREPSEDTWRDAEMYSKMARYTRRFGRWMQ